VPFKSKAQWRACFAVDDQDWDCAEFVQVSPPYEDLPEYVPNKSKSNKEIYSEWRRLVNMSPSELKDFLESSYGKKAGLSQREAKKQGIRRGRDSARAILRMKKKPVSNWSEADWDWARRQVSFIKRMRGVKGPYFDSKGEPTRKLLALLIWGHNPL